MSTLRTPSVPSSASCTLTLVLPVPSLLRIPPSPCPHPHLAVPSPRQPPRLHPSQVSKKRINWGSYKIDKNKNKVGVFVSLVSTKVPFKGTGKEYIGDDIPEVQAAVKYTQRDQTLTGS